MRPGRAETIIQEHVRGQRSILQQKTAVYCKKWLNVVGKAVFFDPTCVTQSDLITCPSAGNRQII